MSASWDNPFNFCVCLEFLTIKCLGKRKKNFSKKWTQDNK
jgi:hypothetical protein